MTIRKIMSWLLAVFLLTGSTVIAADAAAEEAQKEQRPVSAQFEYFEQVAEHLSRLYIDETLSKEDIMQMGISQFLEGDEETAERLLKAMVSSLDDYSEFFTKEEYQEYMNRLNKTAYGIGVVIQKQGGNISITNFLDGSSAQAAGCMIGDKIIRVDGVNVENENVSVVSSLITGELGTTVSITVLRGEEEKDFVIKRSEIKGNTVAYQKMSDDIGYIQVISMSLDTGKEFKSALDYMKSNGIKKIILDLRNNGGGYVVSGIEIARMIVPKGKICDTIFRDDASNVTYNSELEAKTFDFNVLVNEKTASAAEILASAIQESGAGKLIGEQTFGKAVIQKPYTMMNGAVFSITVGKYTTRNGNEINKIGIAPDVWETNVTNPINTEEYTKFSYQTRYDLGMTGTDVKAAKERLYLLGYYNGVVDENYDQEIFDAVKQFQADSELYAYGVMDITTQVQMENRFAKLEVVTDKQLETAFTMFGGDAAAYGK